MHVDKLKTYSGTPHRSWLTVTSEVEGEKADQEFSATPVLPNFLIGPAIAPAAIHHPLLSLRNYQGPDNRRPRGFATNLGFPVETRVGPDSSLTLSVGVERSACPVLKDTDLTIVKELDAAPINKSLTIAKVPLVDHVATNVPSVSESESSVVAGTPLVDQVATQVTRVSGDIALSITEVRTSDHETPPATSVSGSVNTLVPKTSTFDKVTTSVVPVSKDVETVVAGAPPIDPTAMHATPVRNVELSPSQWTDDRPGVRMGARLSLVSRQQSRKGCIPSMTVTADVHSAGGNDSPGNINPQSLILTKYKSSLSSTLTSRKDHGSLRSTLNPLASEFVPASTRKEEVYSVDWPARERRTPRRTKMPKKYDNYYVEGGSTFFRQHRLR